METNTEREQNRVHEEALKIMRDLWTKNFSVRQIGDTAKEVLRLIEIELSNGRGSHSFLKGEVMTREQVLSEQGRS